MKDLKVPKAYFLTYILSNGMEIAQFDEDLGYLFKELMLRCELYKAKVLSFDIQEIY